MTNPRKKGKETKKSTNGDVVTPGEKLGVIEEFIPAEGVYERDGILFAAIYGKVYVDKKNHKIRVTNNKRMILPMKGRLGIGFAIKVKKQFASLHIYYLQDSNSFVETSVPFSATLHISNVPGRHFKSMFDIIRPGDWAIVKILKNDETPLYVALSPSQKKSGVILAYCIYCGSDLDYYRRNLLVCRSCGEVQSRALSPDFGKAFSFT
ncbi:MAG: exosome complex RNA-binding protein Csl4 [Candidatus Hodarchaeales archaeon]|jgi:exosome complex component CSL4